MLKEMIERERVNAWALIRKGGLSAKIGRAFLKYYGAV